MSRNNKHGTPAFQEWLAQNEDRLIEKYAFDVFELSKEQDPEKLKQISSFSHYARGVFAAEKDDGEL